MAVLVSVGDARFVHCAALSFTVIGKRPGGWNKGGEGKNAGKAEKQKRKGRKSKCRKGGKGA